MQRFARALECVDAWVQRFARALEYVDAWVQRFAGANVCGLRKQARSHARAPSAHTTRRLAAAFAGALAAADRDREEPAVPGHVDHVGRQPAPGTHRVCASLLYPSSH